MPILRVPAGAATAPPPKAKAPAPKAPPRVTAPVSGPKTVSNYAPPGKSSTAALPTPTHGARAVTNYAPSPKAAKPTVGPRGTPLAAVTPPHPSGGFLHELGVIGKGIGHVALHTVEDVPALVKGTVVGGEALGKGAVQSVEQGSLTPLGHVLHGMWHNSIPQLLLEGAFEHPFDAKGLRIAHQIDSDFYNHPLQSVVQVSPLGKLADLGKAGAADATTLAAKASENGSDISTLHPTSVALRALPRVAAAKLKAAATGNSDLAMPLGHAAVDVRLNDMVDNLKGAETRSLRHSLEEHSNRLRKTLKGADPIVKHNLTRAVIGELRNRGTARTDLNNLSDTLRESHDKVVSGEWKPNGISKKAALKAISAQHTQLEKLLDSPRFNDHINTIFEMKPQIVAHIEDIDSEMKRLGLLAESQAEKRAVQPYALTHVPGARMATEADKLPQHYESIAADRELKVAQAKHAEADNAYSQVNGLRGRGSRLETDSELKDARQQLSNAKARERSARSFIQGRVGIKTPLKPGQYLRLDKAMRNVEQRQAALADVLGRHQSDRSFLQQRAKANLLTSAKELEDAKQQSNYLAPFRGQHYVGTMVDDGTGGRPLSTEEIKAHMRANGVDPTAYVSGKLPTEAQSLMSRWRGSRGDTPGPAYGGTSLKGLWDSSAEGLHNSMLQSVRRIEQAKAHDRIVHQLAVARDLTPQQASDLAERYEAQTGIPLDAVNQHSARLGEEQAAKVHDLQGSLQVDPQHILNDPSARVSLVPRTALNRLEQHAKADAAAPMIQTINRAFRNAVLPFSPKWITGNAVEAGVRSALARVRPGDAKLFDKVMASIPKDQRDEFLAQSGASAGTHFGFADERNFVSSLRPGSDADPNLANAVRRSGKRILSYYTGVRNGIYHLNRSLETRFEKGVAGAQIRAWSKTWDDAVKSQQDYFEKLGQHVATPEMAEETARQIHQVLGKYTDFSPTTKRFINSVAPFGPWYLNAMKFVTYTLPVKHPLVNAALTATGAHEQAYVNSAQPFGKDFLGTKVGDMTTQIKHGDSYTSIDRYLPEGAFNDGPVSAVTGALAPQAMGAMLAAYGKSPYGDDLYDQSDKAVSPGSAEAGIAALNQLFTEFLPASNLIEQAELGGNTATGTSTIFDPQPKASTDAGYSLPRALGKQLPFWPTNLGVRAPSKSVVTTLRQPNIPGGVLKVPGGKSKIPGGKLNVPNGR